MTSTTTTRRRGVRQRLRESFTKGGLFGDYRPPAPEPTYAELKKRFVSTLRPEPPAKKRPLLAESSPDGSDEYDAILKAAGGKFVVR